MVSFTFDFDKPDKKYRAGESVRCKISVNVFSKFKAKSLSVRFRGKAHTEWTKSRTETRDGKTRTVYDTFTGHEEYFRQYQYLFGSENASENTEVNEGLHTYNVSFPLPTNLPSSIDESNGYVRYDLKAKYDISWGFDKDSSSTFYVTSRLDLNEFPHLLEPVKDVREKTFGCCCCKTDPMQLINILPRAGFVLGEFIPVTIQIVNNSDVRIEGVRVKFKEEITFITRSPRTDTRSSTKTLNEHFFETPIAPYQNKIFQTEFFLDPEHDFKLFNGCGIINSEYYIISEAEASGCHSNPTQSTKITIGTIPFNVLQTNGNGIFNATAPVDAPVVVEQPLPTYQEAARAPSPLPGASGGIGWNVAGLSVSPKGAPLASTEKIFLDDNLPPPSFEDSQKMKKAIEAGEGELPSAPTEFNPTAPPQ
ncbi:arrestin domain-containing protein 2-like [Culicoides brevitarsis]|uniref:arrestin domain-containing protein 2-like n=1 Tax=Culicoides brevitarsis TaxID=469753 RepID=UPI00307C8344